MKEWKEVFYLSVWVFILGSMFNALCVGIFLENEFYENEFLKSAQFNISLILVGVVLLIAVIVYLVSFFRTFEIVKRET